MADGTVTPIRPDPPYSDTAALNDIHVLLTATDPGDETLADIAAILARTGRPLIPVRDIETIHDRDRAGLAGRLRGCRGHRRLRAPGPGRDRAGDRDLHQDRRRAGLPGRHPRRPPPASGRAVPGPGRLTTAPPDGRNPMIPPTTGPS